MLMKEQTRGPSRPFHPNCCSGRTWTSCPAGEMHNRRKAKENILNLKLYGGSHFESNKNSLQRRRIGREGPPKSNSTLRAELYFFFKFIYLFWERERDRERQRQRQNPKQALHSHKEPDVELQLTPWDHDPSRSWTLHQLSSIFKMQ